MVGRQRTGTLHFRYTGTTSDAYISSFTAHSNGKFVVTGIPPGTYDLSLKLDHWLRQVLPGVSISAPSTTGISFSLRNGDADDDNRCNLKDLGLVLLDYEGGEPGDLTGDGVTDLADIVAVLHNFGRRGDN